MNHLPCLHWLSEDGDGALICSGTFLGGYLLVVQDRRDAQIYHSPLTSLNIHKDVDLKLEFQ